MIPSTQEVFEIDSPDEFIALSQRKDLGETSAQWWVAVISACSSCLAISTADGQESEALKWHQAMMVVLDAAGRSGALGERDLLARRLKVKISLLRMGRSDYGSAGLVCSDTLDELTEMEESFQKIQNDLQLVSHGAAEAANRVHELSRLRAIVRDLADMRDMIQDCVTSRRLMEWMEIFGIS